MSIGVLQDVGHCLCSQCALYFLSDLPDGHDATEALRCKTCSSELAVFGVGVHLGSVGKSICLVCTSKCIWVKNAQATNGDDSLDLVSKFRHCWCVDASTGQNDGECCRSPTQFDECVHHCPAF